MNLHLPLIQELLAEQQNLTAISEFAKKHDAGQLDDDKRTYESRIPLTRPSPGQQYAFSVDLDACTGCKACVVGCNKQNGLDADEAWRNVGLIHGDDEEEALQQTVTTACHHCLDPGCMKGCPVAAYEKDLETGIVRHLDDQCIGCQYCTMTCPYDVPQYNARLGIVRKCDMCSDRLAESEAPACVQSCPNGAIAIRLVEQEEVRKESGGQPFLPEAPEPGLTAPTTRYETKRTWNDDVAPADRHELSPAHRHLPLTAMLVLTQLCAGAFFVQAALFSSDLTQTAAGSVALRLSATLALGAGLAGLGAALLHLGRPLYAFRAFLGLRTSWMSREIAIFGMFAALGKLYVLALWRPDWIQAALAAVGLEASTPVVLGGLGPAVASVGAVAVFCSAMIYVVTGRRWWSAALTMPRFFGSAWVLGLSTCGASLAVVGGESSNMALLLLGTGTTKLLFEGAQLRAGDREALDEVARSALLSLGPLRAETKARFLAGALSLLLAPALLLFGNMTPTVVAITWMMALVLAIAGELLERDLFFAASSPRRMPGAIGKA